MSDTIQTDDPKETYDGVRVEYDPAADAWYIDLDMDTGDGYSWHRETLRQDSRTVNFDYNDEGKLVGIEIV